MGLALPFLLAYLLDLLLGDPPGWPHPVRLLGSIIQYWETVLYRTQVRAGALFWLAVMATTGVLMLGVLGVAALLPPWGGIAVLVYFLYTGLATRSLHQESRQVEAALVRGDLDGARASLSMIVGRETAHLSPEDMRRAVIETVAENLADGVVAPMFFTLLLGLPGLFLYKAANTMDSMVGYNNYWYAKFGKVAARADDVLNFIPARLTALLMMPTAAALGLDWRGAWRILRRDRAKPPAPTPAGPKPPWPGPWGCAWGVPAPTSAAWWTNPLSATPANPWTRSATARPSASSTAPLWPWPPSPWWAFWPAAPGSGVYCPWSDKAAGNCRNPHQAQGPVSLLNPYQLSAPSNQENRLNLASIQAPLPFKPPPIRCPGGPGYGPGSTEPPFLTGASVNRRGKRMVTVVPLPT